MHIPSPYRSPDPSHHSSASSASFATSPPDAPPLGAATRAATAAAGADGSVAVRRPVPPILHLMRDVTDECKGEPDERPHMLQEWLQVSRSLDAAPFASVVLECEARLRMMHSFTVAFPRPNDLSTAVACECFDKVRTGSVALQHGACLTVAMPRHTTPRHAAPRHR